MAIIEVIYPFVATIDRIREVPKQTMLSMIADAGGYLGLFLGLSMWHIFVEIKAKFKKIVRFVSKLFLFAEDE